MVDLSIYGVKEGTIRAAMLEILSDGLPHTKKELHAVCGPSNLENVEVHITIIRKLLSPFGMDVICEYAKRKTWYRQVRRLNSRE